ncbi:MAG: hypothetical protein LBN22_01185 [Clostridiales Family XIII bacterium]|jgi:hypothetical protein|nr:hypothetical protein [Clostridiales Family XIII bacterium]
MNGKNPTFISDRYRGWLLFVAILLIMGTFAVANPLGAYADPVTDANTNHTVEYIYYTGDEVPLVPVTIAAFEKGYRLIDTQQSQDIKTFPIERTYTTYVEGIVSKDYLAKNNITNVKLQEILISKDRKIDKEQVLEHLPTNDVEELPQKKAFIIKSDADQGATVLSTLDRAGVRYETTGYDEDGIPNEFRAFVTYRGGEKYLDTHYYEAKSTYTTTRTEADTRTQYVILATYEPIVPVLDPEKATKTNANAHDAEDEEMTDGTDTTNAMDTSVDAREPKETFSDSAAVGIEDTQPPKGWHTAQKVIAATIALAVLAAFVLLILWIIIRKRKEKGAQDSRDS